MVHKKSYKKGMKNELQDRRMERKKKNRVHKNSVPLNVNPAS